MTALRATSFALLLLSIAYASSAQQSLVGQWNYVGIQPVDSDPWSQTLIDIMIGKNSYKEFFSNNRYTAYENNQITHGRWELIDSDHKLMTIAYDGEVRTFEITKLTGDSLIILGKKKTYGTLVKDPAANNKSVEEAPQNGPSVRATVKKISKKWIFKDTRLIATPTEAEKAANRIFTNTFRSSWYDFQPDGVAHSKFTDLKKLTWYFQNENKSIVILDENGDGSLWNIIAITSSQLILQKPHASTQLIFEADI